MDKQELRDQTQDDGSSKGRTDVPLSEDSQTKTVLIDFKNPTVQNPWNIGSQASTMQSIRAIRSFSLQSTNTLKHVMHTKRE